MRRVLLLLLPFVAVPPASADHLPGGSITYRCLGGNSYEVVLTLFRDCGGAPLQPQQLQYSNDCGVSFTATGLTPSSIREVSPLCAGELGNSSCNGGAQVGIEVYTYRHTLFLSPCANWTVAWSTCCRQPSLNLVDAPGLYIEARLTNAGGLCANSPEFADDAVPFVCTGQAVSYNAGAMAEDGRVLRHRLMDARYAAPTPTPVNYLSPHFGARPWQGMAIDSITGHITFTPTSQGRITTVVRVDQYDGELQWLGSVMRDFTFVVTACSNTVPPATGGTLNAVIGNGVLTGSRTAQVCAGGSVCLQTLFTDPDAGQSLEVGLNTPPGLAGARLDTNGSNPVLVSVCWDTLDARLGDHYFTIAVADNACPLRGTQTYTYLLRVMPSPNAGADGTALVCPQADPFTLADSLGGNPPPDGAWTGPGGSAHSGVLMPASDPSGAYTYTVTGFPNCVASAVVTVTFRPADEPECVLMNLPDLRIAASQVFPNPTTGPLSVQGLPVDGQLLATLCDTQGRTIWGTRSVAVGGAVRFELPPTIAAGGYVLLLTGPTGELLRPVRVVVER